MELGLFPLAHVVLFPGMSLPLQVFEPRYRQLIAECLQRNEPFGIALIREGDEVGGSAVPYSVGTTARIRSATTGADGRLHVIVAGGRRFLVLALHDDRPYLWADVEYLSDEGGDVPAELVERAREGLVRVRRFGATAAGAFERDPKVPRSPAALADSIGALTTGPAEERQRFLELVNARERLEAVLPALDAVVTEAGKRAASATARRWAAFGMAN